MPVIYDNKPISPAPRVRFNTEKQELPDGRLLSSVVTATLIGSLTAQVTSGVITPLAIESRLSTILRRQEELRAIFANDGRLFEVQGLDGTQPVKFNAKVRSIEFSDGPWVDVCEYTVVLEGEDFSGENADNPHVADASESWSFEEAEAPHTYRVIHQVSATGKAVYDADGSITVSAWENAKSFVQNRLGLDWTTTNAIWSPKSGRTIAEESAVQPDTLVAYNRIVSENVNETAGTYEVSENFVLSANPYTESYTVTTRKVTDQPGTFVVVSINGSIQGLFTELHDNEAKLVNALAAWDTIQDILITRATLYANGATLNPRPSVAQSEANPRDGTVSYSYEYSDRTLVNDTFESYQTEVQTSIEDGVTTVTINGTIAGQHYADDAPGTNFFQRALDQWDSSSKLALFARCVADSGVNDLKPFPVSASMTPNRLEGTINYSYAYSNRTPETVKNEYNVERRTSREDGRTVLIVSGTLTGLRSANPTDPFAANDLLERYDNAKSYWDGMKDGLLGLAATYLDVAGVQSLAFATSEAHLPPQGQITYSYEFNSTPLPITPGALSESVNVSDDDAIPLIAVFPIPGSGDAGPVIQDLNAISEKKRSVTIEIVMPPSANLADITGYPVVDISPYVPSGTGVKKTGDNRQWNPVNGRFVRTVSWIYK
jgi:hypothetical protein